MPKKNRCTMYVHFTEHIWTLKNSRISQGLPFLCTQSQNKSCSQGPVHLSPFGDLVTTLILQDNVIWRCNVYHKTFISPNFEMFQNSIFASTSHSWRHWSWASCWYLRCLCTGRNIAVSLMAANCPNTTEHRTQPSINRKLVKNKMKSNYLVNSV